MAFIADNDKLLDDDQNQQQQGTGSTGSSFISGEGGSQVGDSSGSTVNTGGVGAGGTGGWTNIQSFLGANRGNTGTADYTQKKIGDQFSSEKQSLDTAAGSKVAEGRAQADKIQQANNTYKDTITDASKAYSYQGNQNDDYTTKTQGLRDSVNNQYSGPTNFAYGFGDRTQKYGTAVGDDRAFDTFLNDSYRERSGAPMTSGQLALQRQLDTTNDPLASVRSKLLQDYAGLGDYRDTKVRETDEGLHKASDDYRNYQGQLKNNINNYSFDQDSAQSKAEADARAAYEGARKGDKTGAKSAYWEGYQDVLNNDPTNAGHVWSGITNLTNRNLWGDNLTADQLQREKDYLAGLSVTKSPRLQANANANSGVLDSFYSAQDQKHANTGDAEKRQWNTIMDLLNQTDRKQAGFNVRG